MKSAFLGIWLICNLTRAVPWLLACKGQQNTTHFAWKSHSNYPYSRLTQILVTTSRISFTKIFLDYSCHSFKAIITIEKALRSTKNPVYSLNFPPDSLFFFFRLLQKFRVIKMDLFFQNNIEARLEGQAHTCNTKRSWVPCVPLPSFGIRIDTTSGWFVSIFTGTIPSASLKV